MIGLNVVLDVLQKSNPFSETFSALLAAAETGHIQGYIAAHGGTVSIKGHQLGIKTEAGSQKVRPIL